MTYETTANEPMIPPTITDASTDVNHPANDQETPLSTNNDNPTIDEGFYERLSNTGYCNSLPQGSTCLTYSDNFIWTVSDYPIDSNPYIVGYDNIGRPIEAISCNSADYYHVLGTLFVKSIPRQKTLFIQSASSQDITNTGDYPENAGYTYTTQPYNNQDGTNGFINALNRISANLDPIRTNDIRLTYIGGYAPGSKVNDFDPDLNKLITPLILASFPGNSYDYACIRVYDANGNGLYDSADDVYLDISLPGSSSFGTVSVNDVRLSGPSYLA